MATRVSPERRSTTQPNSHATGIHENGGVQRSLDSNGKRHRERKQDEEHTRRRTQPNGDINLQSARERMKVLSKAPGKSWRSAAPLPRRTSRVMGAVLWCYLRNKAFKLDKDYNISADLSGQANHLGATIEADPIKQKLPENNGGYEALNRGQANYGKYDERMYKQISSEHPIDLRRYQVANCYMGHAGLINSGGASGEDDFCGCNRDGGH